MSATETTKSGTSLGCGPNGMANFATPFETIGRDNQRPRADFANRLMGSSDLYEPTGRRPYASINFVTAHDGFTLRDLVSYNHKHNGAYG